MSAAGAAGNTFLSYSRRQYYFAESLALHLQSHGISIWFDIQQLEPGVDWKADIDAGLAGCTALLLVASRAALASPYVEAEWKNALEHGKPIFVALYERVRLPPELARQAIVVDFRGDFDRAAQTLIAQFQHPTRRAPKPGLGRLPSGVRRMASAMVLYDVAHVLVIILGLVLIGLLGAQGSVIRWFADLIVMGVFSDGQLDSATLYAGYVGILGIMAILNFISKPPMIDDVLRFLRHDFDYATLDALPGRKWNDGLSIWQLLAAWLVLAGSYLYLSTDVIDLPDIPHPRVETTFSWQLLLGLLASIVLLTLLRRIVPRLKPSPPNADIVRWATLGSVSQAWRIQINRRALNEQPLPDERVVQQIAGVRLASAPAGAAAVRAYQIVFARGDEKVAAKVEESLQQQGYWRGDDAAAYRVLIISYHTPLSLIRECVQHPHVIGVLATDANVPTDLPELTRLQLIDYRSGDRQQLEAHFRYLLDDSEAARVALSQRVLPVSLAQKGNYQSLQVTHTFLLLLVLMNGIYIGYAGIRLLEAAVMPMPILVGIACVAVASLLLIWFARGVLHGVARLSPYVLFGVGVVLPLAVVTAVELISGLPQQFVLPSPSGESIVFAFDPRQGIAFVIAYAILALVFAGSFMTDPAHFNPPHSEALGLRVKPDWKGIISAFGVVIILVLLSPLAAN